MQIKTKETIIKLEKYSLPMTLFSLLNTGVQSIDLRVFEANKHSSCDDI